MSVSGQRGAGKRRSQRFAEVGARRPSSERRPPWYWSAFSPSYLGAFIVGGARSPVLVQVAAEFTSVSLAWAVVAYFLISSIARLRQPSGQTPQA